MDDLIHEVKVIINRDDIESLKTYYTDLLETYETETIDFPYIFRHIYVHACLKKKITIVNWLKEMYETMDPIMKIGLRQIFAYGEYLLRK